MSLRQPLNASFTKEGGNLILPDRRNFSFFHLFGVDATQSRNNRVNPGVVTATVSALTSNTYGSDYIDIVGSDAAYKRLDIGLTLAPSDAYTIIGAFTKGGNVSALEAINGTTRLGFSLSATKIISRNHNTTGQAESNWPADVGTKAVFVAMVGRWNDFSRHIIGVGGTHLSYDETGPAGEWCFGTTGGFDPTTLVIGNFTMARTGGGTGATKAKVAGGATRECEYAELLEIYKRLYVKLGSAQLY